MTEPELDDIEKAPIVIQRSSATQADHDTIEIPDESNTETILEPQKVAISTSEFSDLLQEVLALTPKKAVIQNRDSRKRTVWVFVRSLGFGNVCSLFFDQSNIFSYVLALLDVPKFLILMKLFLVFLLHTTCLMSSNILSVTTPSSGMSGTSL